MKDVLGLPLERAAALLAGEGLRVCAQELRSRKGLAGNEDRVIRQRFVPPDGVELLYASFKTDAVNQND